ncbi:hypothetical protein HDU76_011939, partial [Blyttiomyces sp. JEL0837]
MILTSAVIWTSEADDSSNLVMMICSWTLPVLGYFFMYEGDGLFDGVALVLLYVNIAARLISDLNDTSLTFQPSEPLTAFFRLQVFFIFIRLITLTVGFVKPDGRYKKRESGDVVVEDEIGESEVGKNGDVLRGGDGDGGQRGQSGVVESRGNDDEAEVARILAYFAHEMRNPLHAVLGLTEVCLQDFQNLNSGELSSEDLMTV